MKQFFFDVETTGLDPKVHGIHQIAGAIVINGIMSTRFNYKVKPFPGQLINKEAMAVSGVTVEDLKTYMEPRDCHFLFMNMLAGHVDKFDKTDKMFLCGYNNAGFDNDFFRAFFSNCGDKYFGSWFWSSSIDVMVLAAEHLKFERSKMENFKLHTVAKQMGIELDQEKLHDAGYDIDLTIGIYNRINKEKEKLNHYRDSSLGLWCLDKDPRKLTKKQIIDICFQLTQ